MPQPPAGSSENGGLGLGTIELTGHIRQSVVADIARNPCVHRFTEEASSTMVRACGHSGHVPHLWYNLERGAGSGW